MKTEKALKWVFKGVKTLTIAGVMAILLIFVYAMQLSKILNK